MNEALQKKLALAKYKEILLYAPAKEANHAFAALNLPTQAGEKAWDLVLAYTYSLEEMKGALLALWQTKNLAENGVCYLLYPKIKNKLGHAHVHRDDIFPYLSVDEDGYALDTEYKFNKMVALDDTYTLIGLKYAPKAKQKKSNAPSQCVVDYIDNVADVKALLQARPEVLALYESLTPGYQRDWARYLYSAKSEVTRQKRYLEMLGILQAGYKSKQLYQAAKKTSEKRR